MSNYAGLANPLLLIRISSAHGNRVSVTAALRASVAHRHRHRLIIPTAVSLPQDITASTVRVAYARRRTDVSGFVEVASDAEQMGLSLVTSGRTRSGRPRAVSQRH